MLGQGTNRLYQWHGSDGSGWGSEQTGLVRAWWRQGCRQGSEVSATALVETGGTLVTTAMEAGKLRERRRQ